METQSGSPIGRRKHASTATAPTCTSYIHRYISTSRQIKTQKIVNTSNSYILYIMVAATPNVFRLKKKKTSTERGGRTSSELPIAIGRQTSFRSEHRRIHTDPFTAFTPQKVAETDTRNRTGPRRRHQKLSPDRHIFYTRCLDAAPIRTRSFASSC